MSQIAVTNGSELIDHSSDHPEAAPPVPGAANLILIDNYDSFTWNVYQYLVLEGAIVTVFRNDEITLEELIAKRPTQLVISPGPGHPDRDAGISKDAVRHFAGKIPVLGVCMGEQCIFSVFGGQVEVTGEILHGKTSPLRHDNRGLFAGLAQDLPITRYHSLAGTHPTLPDCLEVSGWIASGPDGGKGIIMGVRHKELLVEGVQFHPESILTLEGRSMLKNFLTMNGGTWTENQSSLQSVKASSGVKAVESMTNGGTEPIGRKQDSILERIFSRRRSMVDAQKQIPSQRPFDLKAAYDLGIAPPLISFPARLRSSPFSLSLAAEVKRASPSKGDIAPFIYAATQAKKYAQAGASVISVLTEPDWFKGSIDDLRTVRQSLEGMPNRPAILRKDFIFDAYQILEARLAGADTVLLIVKMLSQDVLRMLYLYSRSLGMEPLIEVNTVEEMKIALDLNAQVIGVNNRNLSNFEVDLETTSRLMSGVPKGTIIAALSGISGPKDIEAYKKNGVGAVLVGEALMRHDNTSEFVKKLLGEEEPAVTTSNRLDLMVKICGTRTPEAARVAITSGADMVGMILVEGVKRYVSPEIALKISKMVHGTPKPTSNLDVRPLVGDNFQGTEFFDHTSRFFQRDDRALIVGVFQNQPLSYILAQQKFLDLDVVQLHGSEPIEWASLIPVPVIRRFSPDDPGARRRGYHSLPLFDSAAGGTGKRLNITAVKDSLSFDPGMRTIYAGGLNADNVQKVLLDLANFSSQVVAVDVSSGVEEDGEQSLVKIRDFITAAKGTPGRFEY